MNMEWRNGGVEERRRTFLPFFRSSTLPLVFSQCTSYEKIRYHPRKLKKKIRFLTVSEILGTFR
jgi:hypothetical protein